MIDFHTHILPNIDDGSSSLDMSYAMIDSVKKQGADSIVLIPHYYFDRESISDFISSRKDALKLLLSDEAKRKQFPDLFLGAEVALFPMMSKMKDIEKLCIIGTKFMMVEMPYGKWSRASIAEVDNLYTRHGITPIIAHIERFIASQKGTDNIESLLGLDVLIQMNCGAIEKKFFNRTNHNLVKTGRIDLIGTDCHNMTTRKPNMDIGIKYITNHFGISMLNEIDKCGRDVLKNASRY